MVSNNNKVRCVLVGLLTIALSSGVVRAIETYQLALATPGITFLVMVRGLQTLAQYLDSQNGNLGGNSNVGSQEVFEDCVPLLSNVTGLQGSTDMRSLYGMNECPQEN